MRPTNASSKETYLGTGGFIVEKFVIASLAQKILPDEKLGLWLQKMGS
jgi:hypothetical protein